MLSESVPAHTTQVGCLGWRWIRVVKKAAALFERYGLVGCFRIHRQLVRPAVISHQRAVT